MKKYQAPSMAEALAMVRAELGPAAVILHAAEGKKGLLGKGIVEVVAAIDDTAPPRPSAVARAAQVAATPSRPLPSRALPSRSVASSADGGRPRTARPGGGDLAAPGRALTPTLSQREREGGLAIREMQEQVKELRRAFGKMIQHAQWPGIAKLAPPLADLYHRLLDQEVDPGLAQEMVTTIDGELSLQAAGDAATVLDCLTKHLRRMLPAAGALAPAEGEPRVVFLIGPTGVGKTTTIAKMAANLALERHRVALITCDTYRIAAIPQLRTYADILRVPIEVAYSPDELTAKVVDHLDKDFIIVDTPGRSQRNSDQLEELRRFVLAVPSRTTLLTVSAGARFRDTLDVVSRFGVIPFDGLLLTKLDETTSFGPLLNLVHRTKKPVTYLTDGQNVPQDISVATSAGLASLLVGAAYAAEPAVA